MLLGITEHILKTNGDCKLQRAQKQPRIKTCEVKQVENDFMNPKCNDPND